MSREALFAADIQKLKRYIHDVCDKHHGHPVTPELKFKIRTYIQKEVKRLVDKWHLTSEPTVDVNNDLEREWFEAQIQKLKSLQKSSGMWVEYDKKIQRLKSRVDSLKPQKDPSTISVELKDYACGQWNEWRW